MVWYKTFIVRVSKVSFCYFYVSRKYFMLLLDFCELINIVLLFFCSMVQCCYFRLDSWKQLMYMADSCVVTSTMLFAIPPQQKPVIFSQTVKCMKNLAKPQELHINLACHRKKNTVSNDTQNIYFLSKYQILYSLL